MLSAGGLFAAWEAGVWKALCGRFQPDLIVGTSAGAWNGWAIAGGCEPSELIAEWRDPRIAAILRAGLHPGGISRAGPLRRKARQLFNRFHPRLPFGLTVVEVPGMRPRLILDSAITWRHLAATCSVPLVFPPVKIEGRRYVDGGLLGALPLWAAAEMGATRVIAVNALTTLPLRILGAVMRSRRAGRELEIVRIEPPEPLGPLRDAFRWSAVNIERWIAQGESDAKRVASSITM